MLVLAMAAFAASTIAMQPADTAKPIRVALVCAKSSQKTSGLTKICYYGCTKSEGALTLTAYEACPRWTPRWRREASTFLAPVPDRMQSHSMVT